MTDQHMQPKNTFLVMNFFINQVESTPNTVFNKRRGIIDKNK